jgi:uncharacterized membrane protein YebE (DUF533 family)
MDENESRDPADAEELAEQTHYRSNTPLIVTSSVGAAAALGNLALNAYNTFKGQGEQPPAADSPPSSPQDAAPPAPPPSED